MRPSEFWAQIFALPEQARQAEGEAGELRVRADALAAWAKLAMSAHRDALFAADAEDPHRAAEILENIPPRPDLGKAYGVQPIAPDIFGVNKRKQRSDAGKPRGRKTDASASANPADVRAEDAARVKLAGELRSIVASSTGPITVSWLYAQVDESSEEKIRDALKLLSLVSWRMRREGDSQPVEVWGTVEQFAQSVGRMSVRSGEYIADTIAMFGCSEFDAKRVWKFLDPMRSP